MATDSLQSSTNKTITDVKATPATNVSTKKSEEKADTPIDSIALSDSVATDSIAADSIAATITQPVKKVTPPPPPPAWTSGLEPIKLPTRADHDSVIMTSLVVLLLLLVLCVQKSRRLLPMLFKDIWRVRTREKNFDEHTANENQIISVFGLQLTVYLAILLSAGTDLLAGRPPLADTAVTLLPAFGICLGFYLFQLVASWAVGYAFTSTTGRRMWLRGFNAIQTFLGFALAIPALVVIFYPDATPTALIIGSICYFISRIVLISKCFRIFYHNFSSLLYFILYLCTLEITPLFILFRLASTFSL